MHFSGSVLAAAFCACLAACAAITQAPDTAVMPQGALGTNGDEDVRSLQIADFYFGRPIVADPARAAEAIAALDYVGGTLNSASRWQGMPVLFRAQMLQARQTIRQLVGISATAPAQAVVDTMLGLAQAYRAGDQPAIQRWLASPIFIQPPDAVAAHLADIPLIASVNAATTHADLLSLSFAR